MKLFTCLAGAVIALGVVGCKNESATTSTGGEKSTGQKVADGIKSAADSAGAAVDATTQGAKNAKDSVVKSVTPSGSGDVNGGMRGLLEGVVQNAVDNNNFKRMTNHLVDADQKRLEAANVDLTALNASIDKFKAAWKTKYADVSFGAMDAEKVFSPDFIAFQEVPASGDMKMRGAKATIKASHGMPEVTVPAVDQDGKWRLNLDDKVDAQTLVANLQKGLDELTAKQAEWPADKNQAYQAVAHHVLMILTKA